MMESILHSMESTLKKSVESIPHSMESIPHFMESIFKKYGVHPQVHGIHPPFHGIHLKNVWSPSPIPWISSEISGVHPPFHGFHMDYPREGKVQLESPDVYPQQMDLSAGNVENANLNISTQAHQDFKFQSSGHQYINLAIQLVRNGKELSRREQLRFTNWIH